MAARQHYPGSVDRYSSGRGGASGRRRALNAFIGAILAGILAVLCFQIYRVSTGQVAVYGQDKPPAEIFSKGTAAGSGSAPPAKNYAKTPQVQQIIGSDPVPATKLGGTENSVTFRSQSGAVVCTIAKDVSRPEASGLIPPVADRHGNPAKGPGVVCATVHNIRLNPGDGRRCPDSTLRQSTFGVWGSTTGVGSCLDDIAPLTRDARTHAEGGDRFNIAALGYGQHVELGSYGCIMSGARATCANLKTGSGFTVEDNVSYWFFGGAHGSGQNG